MESGWFVGLVDLLRNPGPLGIDLVDIWDPHRWCLNPVGFSSEEDWVEPRGMPLVFNPVFPEARSLTGYKPSWELVAWCLCGIGCLGGWIG